MRGSGAVASNRVVYVSESDYIVLFTVVLLVLIGVTMVFSASYFYGGTKAGDMFFFLKRQGIAAITGICAMVFMSSFNYRHLRNLSWLMYAFSVVGLLMVLIFGETTNGAKRWIEVPLFGSFQPSEAAKIAVTLVLANMIAADRSMFKTFHGYLKCGIVIALPIALILIGKNLSTVLLIGAIGGGIIFVASPYFWRYIFLIVGGAGGLIAYLMYGGGYHSVRWQAFLDPWSDPSGKGYQTIQSLYAVASGGLFGLGLGQSRQKLGYIPEAYNDIIFSIICEELGFIGACFILFLFSVFIWRAVRIAMNASDLFGTLTVAGILIQVGVQVIINVGVVTKTIPNTGIPMPFISYGGTAMAFNLFSMGIVLNISRYSKKNV